MFEEGTKITMADGNLEDIHNLRENDIVMSDNGTTARVISISRDIQTTYLLSQRTKHRKTENNMTFDRSYRENIDGVLDLKCSLGHTLNLTLSTKPTLEKSFKLNQILVRWIQLEDIVTANGRIINIPKFHNKKFPLNDIGTLEAQTYLNSILVQNSKPLVYDLEVRDLDYLDAQSRSRSKLCVKPVLTGNGRLSEFLTGQRHLNTLSVQNMAWLIGLWIGDGTTVRPEISVDSLDTSLMEALIELTKPWGIYPSYTDSVIPLRAKHVKLYYGKKPANKKYYQNCKTNNPFWKVVTELDFKNREDGSKEIPPFLYCDDIEIREAFLAGLIDADGYVSKEVSQSGKYQVNIQTIYPSVMKGIINIARSLSINTTITSKPERIAIIKGKEVHCKLTYDCGMTGTTALQNVLSYCHSGHKIRPKPANIDRGPTYFTFDHNKRGLNHVYSIKLENSKKIVLGNKMSLNNCNINCMSEQKKLSKTKNSKQCLACRYIGIGRFYRDWTGKNKLCSRCYARYKFSGYRCKSCNFVPDSREIKRKCNQQEENIEELHVNKILECSHCMGVLAYDVIRGPNRQVHMIHAM
ncbi:similar to Saccharomyces cerevisiae YDL227C HO Site-specific endonuclease required for gene conversion at the MAT locus (homothallic switching) through the generation of a ds DNA break [Maudiozyma barnettii]|uniref:Similar to Saccharomyces cerevisiae YDL227C HO Site-specific endonuclease required for gene conversion at the MAT locus (Homothallic switching) through the generation of a ds DNA break n=1 Tax=Maudiozyma barnettii TaxID=61262 RepID=A0A8H2ZIW8_9SACH|nr:Hop [Kazachstania barnettii]CAB4255947.1 similar to Saccharomyces cerevisiae YDL227C HO Site-specific endonuclease required for gene conversion at the MAT locus (homothallic switching) through the generation of a ds DNA break [Kazachstania barnettii]CAD1784507.1 similar to Saccharomyces cerevisiae YDL227C HO Site-specific endonuclease required for gene conversion at the MAT locus (homothallic switching) through the generation of a ds DNA break [Kazachstania barnettii]